MEAVLLLADAAETNNGKVSALGLGWSQTGSPTPPAALVLFLKVPWELTNVKQTLVLHLLDEDGAPAGSTENDQGLRIEGVFEADRPVGLPHGRPIDNAVVVSLPAGLPLRPGGYEWVVEVEGEPVARRGFLVRPTAG